MNCVYCCFQTKDEFLGMFLVDLTMNIPYESAEQPMLTKDFSLTKRRYDGVFFEEMNCLLVYKFSILQRVRGTATIGLAYLNSPGTLTHAESSEIETNGSEVRYQQIWFIHTFNCSHFDR